MTKLVTFPIQCGDDIHCIDLDTEYNARVRSHTQEDINIERTIKDLCPEYEGSGCMRFLDSLDLQIANFDDHRDSDYSGKSHGVSLLWMLYANDYIVPYHVRAVCYAQCMKYLIKKNWLVAFNGVDVVYDYLNELIENDGKSVSLKVASSGLGARIYRIAPESKSSHLTDEWVRYFERYVNKTMVYRINSLFESEASYFDREIMDEVTSFYNRFFDNIYNGVFPNYAKWYDDMMASAIKEYAKKEGCVV